MNSKYDPLKINIFYDKKETGRIILLMFIVK